MGTTRAQWQRVRKLTPVTGETAITTFLRQTSTEELWLLTPPMAALLPEKLKADYAWGCSPDGLRACYGGCPDVIRPMLDLLLRRWHLTAPGDVAEVLDLLTNFVHRRRWLLPQLEPARARGLSEEALCALYDRLAAEYDRVHGDI